MRIYESGMIFGDYDIDNCFHIEKTKLYKKLNGKGYSSVEFILHRPDKKQLLFIEAKSSLPDVKNINKYDERITEISKDFKDSFHLTCGIWFGQNNSKVDMPANGSCFFSYGTQVVFVLVIKNRTGNLTRIAEEIKRELIREYRLWQFDILVMNEDDVRTYKLVVSDEQT